MSETPTNLSMNRVVIALDACSFNERAIEIAAQFAADGQLELVGIFIEDEDLLRLSGLPFAREFSATSRTSRAINPPDIEEDYARAAAQARRTLARLAEGLGLTWHFDIVRKDMEQALADLVGPSDVLVVDEKTGRLTEWSSTLSGKVARREIRCSTSVFVNRQSALRPGAITALVDVGRGDMRYLDQIVQIANARARPLHIILVSDAANREDALRTIQNIGSQTSTGVTVMASFDAPEILKALDQLRPSLVILCGQDNTPDTEDRLHLLAPRLSVPVLLLAG